jgi:hypothetical protein
MWLKGRPSWLMLVLVGGCVAGCGIAETNSVRPSSRVVNANGVTKRHAQIRAVKSYRTGDNDVDDEYGKDSPDDDYPLTKYGRAANIAEKRAVAGLLRRYYAAAAVEDGWKACSMLYSGLAKDLRMTRTVPHDRFSYPIRVHISPDEKCPGVMSRLFKRRHDGLVQEVPTLQVTAVRVNGAHGVAVLGFKTVPEHWMPIVREDGRWKVHSVLGLLLP